MMSRKATFRKLKSLSQYLISVRFSPHESWTPVVRGLLASSAGWSILTSEPGQAIREDRACDIQRDDAPEASRRTALVLKDEILGGSVGRPKMLYKPSPKLLERMLQTK